MSQLGLPPKLIGVLIFAMAEVLSDKFNVFPPLSIFAIDNSPLIKLFESETIPAT